MLSSSSFTPARACVSSRGTSTMRTTTTHSRGGPSSCPARSRSALPATWMDEAIAKANASVNLKKGKDAKKMSGFRYDGSMMRWIKDDRIQWDRDQAMATMARPKTGEAYTVWPVVWQTLTDEGVKMVTCEEASNMTSKGWTIVDVRLSGDYEKQHAAGAINLPLFRYVQGTEMWDQIKKFVMMTALAMMATERDPDYLEMIKSELKPNSKVILMCAIGGTLRVGTNLRPDKYPNGNADPDRNFGRESRALKAAYEFYRAGWSAKNIVFVEGGLQQWRYQGFEMEGEDFE
ncbi:hypothetical protein FOA52_015444 [Chlamydomonas sp. UWO 241]|nr:hypothetical protein FOA52_015444 [Chlamydomonas sp. UWO 241]